MRRPVLRSDSETILVVDPDSFTRKPISGILRSAGYRILEARSADQGLALCRWHGESIGLIIAEILLPDSSGPELVEQVIRRWPAIPVLFVSDSRDNDISQFYPGSGFLIRPFTAEYLCGYVRRTLELAWPDRALPRYGADPQSSVRSRRSS